MRKIKYLLILLTILISNNYSQPKVNGRFLLVTNNGTNYVVKVQISYDTGLDALGDATIPFTFNTSDLSYVSTTFHNFTGGAYNTATITISTNRISLNIVYNSSVAGTIVSNTFMDVATITFSTLNTGGQSNLLFTTPMEFFNTSFAQWTNGTFTDLNTTPLPVELTSFTAMAMSNNVVLDWKTATEVNSYGFEVERASRQVGTTPSQGWEKIGFVAGNGNSNSPKDYSFIDFNPSGGSKFIYRLKQIDNNGKFEYSDEVEIDLAPSEFVLYQNYPNPFNPSTKIQYALSSQQYTTLKIYNVLGNEMQTLVDEVKPAGLHEVTVDAANFPSGIYFYKLRVGSLVETKKMTLLR
jgi:hypothetical protein